MQISQTVSQNESNIHLNKVDFEEIQKLANLKKTSISTLVMDLVHKEIDHNFPYLASELSLAEDWLTEENKVWDNL